MLRDKLCVYPSEFRSQNRISSGTVRFIGVAITQVELRFETERWAACENTNVNIDCKIVLVLKSNAASMDESRRGGGAGDSVKMDAVRRSCATVRAVFGRRAVRGRVSQWRGLWGALRYGMLQARAAVQAPPPK